MIMNYLKLVLLGILCSGGVVHAALSCRQVVSNLNKIIDHPIQRPKRLVTALSNLFIKQRLPAFYISKQEARKKGWVPGESLWDNPKLSGRSIGGDVFLNLEGRLPQDDWLEADVDYMGQRHRGEKRLVFNQKRQVYLTVDHYETFMKVTPCQ
jgi:ribonuclease T1